MSIFGDSDYFEDDIYSAVATNITNDAFETWVKKYKKACEESSNNYIKKFSFDTYMLSPLTLQFNDTKAYIQPSVFSECPITIERIESTKYENITLNVFYSIQDLSKTNESSYIHQDIVDNMLKLTSLHNIGEIFFNCNYGSYDILNTILDFFHETFPHIKLKLYYNNFVYNNSTFITMGRYIMESKYKDFVDVSFTQQYICYKK